jgi:signal transduction histidine kinase
MNNIHLLLVDDEDNFRQTLCKRLEKRGFALEQAANGEECLSILEKKPVNVVVLDVRMPGKSGIDVLRNIKDRYPKTEIILLTGHATTADGVEGIKSGAFDYLTKPVEFEHLVTKILQAYEKIQRLEIERQEAEYRKKMEQQMIATERLASLGTLAAGVAHEINNPLAIIKESVGWMQQLLKKDELKDIPRRNNFEKALDKIEKSIERARRITHQLLGFVKKSDSAFLEVNLNELMEEAVQLIAHEAENRSIDILKQVDPLLETIWSDAYQLRQVFINLLTNAIHTIGSKGTITLALKNAGDHTTFTVSDTGQGIPGENLEKIFEPFFSTKSPGEGTGLGLFVTRGIVEKLGGTVEVESKIGQGASFCIRLPKKFGLNAESIGNSTETPSDRIRVHLENQDNREKNHHD